MQNKFYDIHYHAFDISHANLLSFLSRKDIVTSKSTVSLFNELPFWGKFITCLPIPLIFAGFIKGFIAKKIRNAINNATSVKTLLSVIENAIEYHFLYIEYFLKNKTPTINEITSPADVRLKFNKIVLCPLLMDFGFKNLKNEKSFYNTPPQKPIVNQVVDIFNAIYFYYNYQLLPHSKEESRLQVVSYKSGVDNKLFEIYPFLGINTQNYSIETIEEMFKRYFEGYENDTPSSRQENLKNKLGKCKIDIEEISNLKSSKDESFYKYLFAGIKLYPPLGFDPWPENNEDELKKVKYLYKMCIEKKLPIITHCSDAGFVADTNHELYTNPAKRWKKVIENEAYKDLKIDFAHLGSEGDEKTEWLETIKSYMKIHKNIYGDISCNASKKDYYEKFKGNITSENENQFLFGSDFLINLLFSGSYNEYLNQFINDNQLSIEQKLKMCQTNSEKFLFG